MNSLPVGIMLCLGSLALLPAPASAQSAAQTALCKNERTQKGLEACNAILKRKTPLAARVAAFNNRALTLLALGRTQDAIRDYDEAIRILPNFAALYADRGRAKFAAGDLDGAAEDIALAIDRDEFNPENHANLAYIKILREDYAGARQNVSRGLFWNKNHARSAYILGLIDYRTGQYDMAIAHVDQARQGGFRIIDTMITRSLANFRRRDYAAAESDADAGLREKPDQPDLLEARARIRLALDRSGEALADADAAVRLAPKSALALATRASVRLALKDAAAARADAEAALALDPKLMDGELVRGEALLAAGDRDGARAAWQRAAARTDLKNAQDAALRERAVAALADLDKPKPVIVSELPPDRLRKLCETRNEPLRMAACDRLVETAATPQDKAQMLLLRAQAKLPAEALADLDLALQANPENPELLIARGYQHLATYGYDSNLAPVERAYADADRAVRLSAPGSRPLMNALSARSIAAASLGRFEQAEADLGRILEIEPKAGDFVHQMRATARLMAGKPDAALEDARAARALAASGVATPGFAMSGRVEFALALVETGAAETALAELDAWQADKAVPAVSLAILRGRALLARGEDGAALAAVGPILASQRSQHAALAVRGIASARLGNAAAAEQDLTEVIDRSLPVPAVRQYDLLTPGFAADIYLHRGLARSRLGNYAAARLDFTEAIRRAPEKARAYGERAGITYRAGDAAAVPDIVMALRIEPKEPRWLALAARINLALGDPADAVRTATDALAQGATDPDLLLLRARGRLRQSDFAGAVADAGAHLERNPGDIDGRLLRIEARIGLADLPAAGAEADAMRQSGSGGERLLLLTGEIRALSGDTPGAVAAFEEAARNPAAALRANKRLGDLYGGIGTDALALGYYAKAIELPAVAPEDIAVRGAARSARDALIRKAARPQ